MWAKPYAYKKDTMLEKMLLHGNFIWHYDSKVTIKCGGKRTYSFIIDEFEKRFFHPGNYKEQHPYKRRLTVTEPIFKVEHPKRAYQKKSDYWKKFWLKEWLGCQQDMNLLIELLTDQIMQSWDYLKTLYIYNTTK